MPLDVTDEETVRDIIAQADIMMQVRIHAIQMQYSILQIQYDEHIGPDDKLYDKIDMMNEASAGNDDF